MPRQTYIVPQEVSCDIRTQLDLLDVLCGEPIGSVTKGIRANLDVLDRLCAEQQEDCTDTTLMLGQLSPLPEPERRKLNDTIERTLQRRFGVRLTRLEQERLAKKRRS